MHTSIDINDTYIVYTNRKVCTCVYKCIFLIGEQNKSISFDVFE